MTMESLVLFRLSLLFITLMGVGFFFGMTFPCLNGPFNILKFLRDKIGKPFACPVCSFFWSVVISGLLVFWIPMMYYVIIGAVGWGMMMMHATGYQVIYQGMEDE